jgi:ketosteroid isomerase-like protein
MQTDDSPIPKRRKRSLISILLTLLVGFPALAATGKANTTQAVTAVLQTQADAWNRGDLDSFMTGYLHSPDVCYTSDGVDVWGFEALRDRYQRKYGSNRDSMGQLSFSDVRVFSLGGGNALCIGHWLLNQNSGTTFSGTYSLIFVRTKDGWKIMHDHTSTLPHKPPL